MDAYAIAPNSISLVLPAWNEAEVICQAISEADPALRTIAEHYEIVVVDDGSDDGTATRVEALATKNPAVRLVRHDHNLGYGAALRSGFAAARYQRIAFTDADCQFDLHELNRLLLLSNDYDAVCGYRIDRQDPWLRCFYSQVYNAMVRTLLGIRVRDVDCALKVFRREALARTSIQTDGFLVNTDLLTQIADNGGSIVEVGVTHRPRAAGESTVSITHVPRVLCELTRYWWNNIQFPNRADAPTDDSESTVSPENSSKHDKRLVGLQAALIMVVCLFMFSNLSYPLIDRDETRYAEIPREMLATGDWILPSLNFETYYDKPPMLYWMCAMSYRLFGVNEWAARSVPAVAALGTLVVTMWFGNRHFGHFIGLLTGGVLSLSVGFAFVSRYLLMDGVLMFFVTISLVSAYEAINSIDRRHLRPRLGWWTSAAIFCGLSFLTKGPLSLVLFIPVVGAFNWLTAGTAKLRWTHYLGFLAVVGLIAGPWFLAVTLKDHQFLYEFFYRHNVKRFAGSFHVRPFWYFVPVLLVAGHPWSFLSIPLARHFVSRRKSERGNRPPALGFLALWAGWTFVFFSMSRCKLPTYLLPSAPAYALAIAHFLNHLFRHDALDGSFARLARYWSPWAATAATCIAAAGLVLFAAWSGSIGVAPMLVWLIVWGAIIVMCVLLFSKHRTLGSPWMTSTMVTAVFVAMLMHQMVPAYSRAQTLFAPHSSIAREMGFSTHMPIATVGQEFSEVPFYLHRSDVHNFDAHDSLALSQFIINKDEALIVVDPTMLLGTLRHIMPPGTRLQTLGDRGPARFIRITRPERAVARSQSWPLPDPNNVR